MKKQKVTKHAATTARMIQNVVPSLSDQLIIFCRLTQCLTLPPVIMFLFSIQLSQSIASFINVAIFCPMFLIASPRPLLILRGEAMVIRDMSNINRRVILILYLNALYYKVILQMYFKDDEISEFIKYKLSNPYALFEQMRFIQDKQECIKKFQEYSRHLQQLKNELFTYNQHLDTVTVKKTSIESSYEQQVQQLDENIKVNRKRIEDMKRDTTEKKSNYELYYKKYNEFLMEITIKKKNLVKGQEQQLRLLEQQAVDLSIDNEFKEDQKQKLKEELQILKDREIIIKSTKQNLQVVRKRWQSRQYQLSLHKQQLSQKQNELSDLINKSLSMEKVIYANLYKRCNQTVENLEVNIHKLYDLNQIINQTMSWESKLEKLLLHLKINKEYLLGFLQQKRQRFKINPEMIEPNSVEFNEIVQTKISDDKLNKINEDTYIVNENMYSQIQMSQIQIFDKLKAQRQELELKQEDRMKQIQDLRERISKLNTQIQSKRQTLSPTLKKSKK